MKKLYAVAAVAACSLALAADAEAGWRHGSSGGSWGSGGSYGSAGSYGSSGSWGSSGGSAGYVVSYGSSGSHGSWGGSSGSSGSSGGGLFSRWRARRAARLAARGSHGSSGGSYGSSGGSYGSSGGSHGSSGGSSGTVIMENDWTPAESSTPMPPTPTPVDPPADGTSASLRVRVPADAVVFVNDFRTKTKGEMRNYVSRDLQAGRNYSYEVRAEFKQDGKIVSQTRNVSLTAGKTIDLQFGETQVAATPVDTKLTLNVPADAVVTLAGVKTSQSGEVREFATRTLSAGKAWEEYTIDVTIERDGQEMTDRKVVTLIGGEDMELSFDFDAASKLAQR